MTILCELINSQLTDLKAKGFKNEPSKELLECMISAPREHSSKSSQLLAIKENGSD